MSLRTNLGTLVLGIVLVGFGAAFGQSRRSASPPQDIRGVCYVGRSDKASLAYLAKMGVNWIQINPYAYGQREAHRPPQGGLRFSRFEGESPDGIRTIVRDAKALGFKVLIKPHVWFSKGSDWHGTIAMKSEADWTTWFSTYGAYIEAFAKLAKEEKVDMLAVGNELVATTSRDADWRRLIKRVRRAYDGPLTYGANWDNVHRVPFYDALDVIGVSGYFPLTKSTSPSVDDLVKGWQPYLQRLAAIAKKVKRPLVFTEWGYKNVVGTAKKPWEWRSEEAESEAAQADAYRAFLSASGAAKFVGGGFCWKWYAGYPHRQSRNPHRTRKGFTPQGKAAEKVLRKAFTKASAQSKSSSRPAVEKTGS